MDRKPGHLTKNPQDAVNALNWVKVVGVGSACVGKTCLVKHFCEMRVHLWDLSGSTEYIDVRNELYIQADAIFMAFDVTNQATFDALDSWLKEIQRYTTGTPDLIVVANKTDLKQKRVISTNESKKWANQNRIKYFETSAATGDGVDRLFQDILVTIIERSGRCLLDFFNYRELDMCLQFGPRIDTSDRNNVSFCLGNDLIRIDSQEKEKYIKEITADIGYVYNVPICIQCQNTGSGWKYNDGSEMVYFNWPSGEPNGNTPFLFMVRQFNYQWFVSQSSCSYICEHR
ncbi:DNAJC27 [Mytilus coruscus]|uniref:DNAJC27 n=1 Tax=Mytilus coruscus TaxID=42192 RepID=A0A6J8EIL8_MYTCO|nr:DNAJC27 [Mytilus coruscus]